VINKRLNSVSKELNVTMEVLIDTLLKKNHNLELKPTTKLTDEQYDLILKEFFFVKTAISDLAKDNLYFDNASFIFENNNLEIKECRDCGL
jgi:hypothetical protein